MNSHLLKISKEPTVVTTAGGKAEWTEEATVHVNDSYVFVRIDAVGRFTSRASCGFMM